jgi:hypothetical protein
MRAPIVIVVFLLGWLLLLRPATGHCWGDEGHEIVGLIAEHYLRPEVRTRVAALLAGDSSGLTRTTGIADEATWADKFRDSDRNATRLHYRGTQDWHFIDIEIDRPDVDAACFGHPALPPGGNASQGPAADCIVDKIDQFRAELRNPATAPDERRLALQFLLHLVGDLHQPLHAADDHDRGGNDIRVRAAGSAAGTLHHYWDTVFVGRLGPDATEVAASLILGISDAERRAWDSGSPTDWALESFAIGKAQVYGKLMRVGGGGARGGWGADDGWGSDDGGGRGRRGRRGGRGVTQLDERYAADAEAIVALQLQRAGVRLAWVLNETIR